MKFRRSGKGSDNGGDGGDAPDGADARADEIDEADAGDASEERNGSAGSDDRRESTPAVVTTDSTGIPTDDLIGVEDYKRRLLDVIRPLPEFEQPLLDSLGLVLGEDIEAGIDLPGFDNSSMDGYAVRHGDLAGADDDDPVTLDVIGDIAAGPTGDPLTLRAGQCARIMTGAPVPRGADAVVPLEWTDQGTDRVEVGRQPSAGAFIRQRGEDLEVGEQVLRRGTLIGPREVAVLAALGVSRVRARPLPRVVVLSTGEELAEPGSDLRDGQIYDSNSFTLAAQVRAAGAVAYRVPPASDDPDELRQTLSDQLVRADLIVTSGGVSKGAYDVVKEALGDLGTVEFCEVAMQPGKPQGFGVLGEDETPIITLPGNPVSAYVSFEVFVRPAIRKLCGWTPYDRAPVFATAARPFNPIAGKQRYARAAVDRTDTGWEVRPSGGHGSHLLRGLSRANALAILEPGRERVEAGELVKVLVLDEG